MSATRFGLRVAGPAAGLALALLAAAPAPAQTDAELFARAVEAVRTEQFGTAVGAFETLAEAGDHLAQFNLATLLRAGKGRPQNYAEALRWAWLAQLGGVRRAGPLADELAAMLPEPVLEEVREAVDARLLARLERGERLAILQYARFRLNYLAEPDAETALTWQMIGAALGIPGAADARDATAEEMTAETLVEIQQAATRMFLDDDLAARFAPPAPPPAPQPSGG